MYFVMISHISELALVVLWFHELNFDVVKCIDCTKPKDALIFLCLPVWSKKPFIDFIASTHTDYSRVVGTEVLGLSRNA